MDEVPVNSSSFEYEYSAITPPYYDFVEESPCLLGDVRNFEKLFVPVAYSFICVFGLLGNILVVITFAFYKKVKSMTDVYLFNMALADILFILTLPFWAVNHAAYSWKFSNIMCKLTKGIYAVNFNCGMLLLTCISLDRYIAIVQATRSFRLRSQTLAYKKMICFIVWLFSVIISIPTFIFNQKYPIKEREICEAKYHSSSEAWKWKILILVLQLLFGFFIPLVFMIFCYMFIVKTLVQAHNSKRHKAIRVIIVVVLIFLVLQVPHNMVLLVVANNIGRLRSCSDEKLIAYTRSVTEVLAFLHCCLNPVLYAFIGQKFRNYFLKIMKDLWCLGRKHKLVGFSCSKLSSETYISRQTSETYENENASSFTM